MPSAALRRAAVSLLSSSAADLGVGQVGQVVVDDRLALLRRQRVQRGRAARRRRRRRGSVGRRVGQVARRSGPPRPAPRSWSIALRWAIVTSQPLHVAVRPQSGIGPQRRRGTSRTRRPRRRPGRAAPGTPASPPGRAPGRPPRTGAPAHDANATARHDSPVSRTVMLSRPGRQPEAVGRRCRRAPWARRGRCAGCGRRTRAGRRERSSTSVNGPVRRSTPAMRNMHVSPRLIVTTGASDGSSPSWCRPSRAPGA